MAAACLHEAIERKFASMEVGTVAADGRFSGYASLFDTVDLGRDMIAPGAFAASLRRRGASGVRMLFQHHPDQPIGHWTALREDARGLRVEGKLALDVERARDVHALMKAGALDGLSIGFHTVRAQGEAKTGFRRILEADLWEISIVTFPMLPGARITSVKSGSGRQDAADRRLHAAIDRAAWAMRPIAR
jgi:uncharacterized protein